VPHAARRGTTLMAHSTHSTSAQRQTTLPSQLRFASNSRTLRLRPTLSPMGGAKRYPSNTVCDDVGFREELNPSYALAGRGGVTRSDEHAGGLAATASSCQRPQSPRPRCAMTAC
jgi:hypothetical protein